MNLIIGDAGDDALLGGEDRDVLIGGSGSNQLFGYEGQDILIGGVSNQQKTRLLSILNQWNSPLAFDARSAVVSPQLELSADAKRDDLFGGADQNLLFASSQDLWRDVDAISSIVIVASQQVAEPLAATGEASLGVAADSQQVAWSNPNNPLDVNGDLLVTPLDALIVINELNTTGALAIDTTIGASSQRRPFLDVNEDDFVSPVDALLVVNYLNARSAGAGLPGEGEASLAPPQKDIGSAPVPLALLDVGAHLQSSHRHVDEAGQWRHRVDSALPTRFSAQPMPADKQTDRFTAPRSLHSRERSSASVRDGEGTLSSPASRDLADWLTEEWFEDELLLAEIGRDVDKVWRTS